MFCGHGDSGLSITHTLGSERRPTGTKGTSRWKGLAHQTMTPADPWAQTFGPGGSNSSGLSAQAGRSLRPAGCHRKAHKRRFKGLSKNLATNGPTGRAKGKSPTRGYLVGWGRRIRTPANGSRVHCPTTRRSPKKFAAQRSSAKLCLCTVRQIRPLFATVVVQVTDPVKEKNKGCGPPCRTF